MYSPTATDTIANPLLQLADAMPQLVFISDAEGQVTYFNSRINEYEGGRQRPDGVWEWQDVIHPDELGHTGLTWMHSVATGLPYESEHRMKMADGSYCWHLTRALPQRNAAGAITHWFGTSTNIHQQKHTQQVLRENEERFRILTNTIPQIVWITDGAGKTEYVNDRWSNYTAQSPEEIASAGRTAMMHPDDLPLVMDSWRMAQYEGRSAEWEYRLRHNETGRYTWFAGKVQPLKDESGTIIKWIGAATDIQALKDTAGLLEQQVADRTQALRELNVTLNQQATELQRSNDDLQQFAHVASHDLKEPLRKIRTFASRLANEFATLLPDTATGYIQKIETSAQRMTLMVDGVLQYSVADVVEDRQLVLLSLDDVLRDVCSDLELQIEQKGAVISVDALPEVTGAPVLMQQLFFNLFNNSLKFSRPGITPRVQVSWQIASGAAIRTHNLFRRCRYAAISIADNGIGFDSAYTDSIFKTFTRLHSKDRYEGTGLGLALCQKIAHRHGGAIGASSVLNEGATFTVFLPLADEGPSA
jgi:PAS domain S-box-containing protein